MAVDKCLRAVDNRVCDGSSGGNRCHGADTSLFLSLPRDFHESFRCPRTEMSLFRGIPYDMLIELGRQEMIIKSPFLYHMRYVARVCKIGYFGDIQRSEGLTLARLTGIQNAFISTT